MGFCPETVIRYALGEEVPVRLAVYNLLGQQVRVLVRSVQGPGAYQVRWDGRDEAGRAVAAGLYLYRLEAGPKLAVRKMLVAK